MRTASLELTAIIKARLTMGDEALTSSTVAIGIDLGVDIDQVGAFFDVDFRDALARTRQAVDADPMLADIVSHLIGLDALRADVDRGAATLDQVTTLFDQIGSALDSSWDLRISALRGGPAMTALPGAMHARLTATHEAYQALRSGTQQLGLIAHLVQTAPSTADKFAMVDAGRRYDSAVARLVFDFGPEADAAWRTHRADLGAQRFEHLRDQLELAAVAGTTEGLRADPVAYAQAIADGVPWLSTLVETVHATERDLQAEAGHRAAEAASQLRTIVALSALLTLLTVAGSLLVARFVTQPIARLGATAREVRQGHFALQPLATTGPLELAATAEAFNEMTYTLAEVEAQTISLAEDPDAAVADQPLPGPTGRALGVALDRLRASMRLAEQRRGDLEQAATHDSLTGLFNRPAALEMIERELSRAHRHGGLVTVLFVDLDGLKQINDAHGHATGDDAIVLTAEALRSVTRSADIVARLGGDEFLVCGTVGDASEALSLAERVRAAVASRRVVWTDGGQSLHCSVGMTLARPGDATADRLIGEADTALYDAKRKGRDQMAWFQEVPSPERTNGEVAPLSDRRSALEDVDHDA